MSEDRTRKTVVIGASNNPERYSFRAFRMLREYGHPAIPLGVKKGEIDGVPIINGKPALTDVHTVTLYINPQRQAEWIDYILHLRPKRIIFNPGTENPAFEEVAQKEGIECMEACTLVLLSTHQY